ncbi:MAG TPA: alpha-N-arabinofuranosidase [Roseiflexaceae bacterium]|nr:alpha-N-arabinofuranosidase [Roseiflexaceae bacterium]
MTHSPLTARIVLDNERTIGAISPLLFGGFAEHMGRCVYGGIYDPASPHADERGFRRDVQAALREMRLSILRYPGGNMLSGYDWRDGVGPKEQRPRRRELAWQSLETNQFGTNEFIDYCRATDIIPMLGVNLGTGTIADAAALVEYCNAPTGSHYADLRATHGYAEPHAVKYWCLGNEMDGPWQIGHLEAEEYARKALEAAKMMRWQDPSLKLILCGSSNTEMPTYPEWDRVVLERCWEQVDYLALHYYAINHDNDTASYLALAAQFESHLDTLSGLLRYVKSKRRSKHDVKLSWDEWNVWYKDRSGRGGWKEAPPLSEEVYNLEDALVVAQWMSVFLRRCDVLEIACLAQIVNTISPLTTTAEQLLRQTTFYPFVLFANHAAGQSLDALVTAPLHDTQLYGSMPLLDVSASYDQAGDRGAVFVVNRSQTEAVTTDVVWQGAAPARVTAIHQLAGSDPKAINTFQRPDAIVPKQLEGAPVRDGRITLRLPPLSFTVVATDGYGSGRQ